MVCPLLLVGRTVPNKPKEKEIIKCVFVSVCVSTVTRTLFSGRRQFLCLDLRLIEVIAVWRIFCYVPYFISSNSVTTVDGFPGNCVCHSWLQAVVLRFFLDHPGMLHQHRQLHLHTQLSYNMGLHVIFWIRDVLNFEYNDRRNKIISNEAKPNTHEHQA